MDIDMMNDLHLAHVPDWPSFQNACDYAPDREMPQQIIDRTHQRAAAEVADEQSEDAFWRKELMISVKPTSFDIKEARRKLMERFCATVEGVPDHADADTLIEIFRIESAKLLRGVRALKRIGKDAPFDHAWDRGR